MSLQILVLEIHNICIYPIIQVLCLFFFQTLPHFSEEGSAPCLDLLCTGPDSLGAGMWEMGVM